LTETTHFPGGYETAVRIPLSAIPGIGDISGKKIGFDISVEDSDSNIRKTELVWSGASDNYRDRSRLGILELKK
jgi:hypothetical protein